MVKTVHEWTDYSSAGVVTQKQRIAGRFRQRLSRELKALKESGEYQHADDDTRQELEAALRSHISQDRLAALVNVDVIVTRSAARRLRSTSWLHTSLFSFEPTKI